MNRKMKKNILKITLIAAFALVAGYNMYTSQKSDVKLSDLTLANVEALADCEMSFSGPASYTITYIWTCSWRCSSGGVWQCPQ